MGNYSYDSSLSFDLPFGYVLKKERGDDGGMSYQIECGSVVDASGNNTPELTVKISKNDGEIDSGRINLKGNVPAAALGTTSEIGLQTSIGSDSTGYRTGSALKIKILFFIVALPAGSEYYLLLALKTCKEADVPKNATIISKHMNKVLNSVILNGEKGEFEPITSAFVEKILKEKHGENAEELMKEVGKGDSKAGSVRKTGKDAPANSAGSRDTSAKGKRGSGSKEKDLEKEWIEWKKKCEKQREKREEKFKQATSSEDNPARLKAEKEKKAELDKIDGERALIEKEKEEAQKRLDSLGFFKFSEKKMLREKISEIDMVSLPNIKQRRNEAEEKYVAEFRKINAEEERRIEEIKKQIRKEIPLPRKPLTPPSVEKNIEDELRSLERAGISENTKLKLEIIDILQFSDPMSAKEIAESGGFEARSISHQRISALLRQMVLTKAVERYSEFGVPYYWIP